MSASTIYIRHPFATVTLHTAKVTACDQLSLCVTDVATFDDNDGVLDGGDACPGTPAQICPCHRTFPQS
jgi:hypothetical protein